jgi:uncharacterized Fe-S cluster protein YjdI
MSKDRDYSNGELTVHWRPEKCIHSAVCAKGLPAVFQPRNKPWVKIEEADSESIKAVVDKCPSKALTWTKD